MKAITFTINNESDLIFLQELGKRLHLQTSVHEALLLDDLLWENNFADLHKIQQLATGAEQEIQEGKVFDVEVLCNQK